MDIIEIIDNLILNSNDPTILTRMLECVKRVKESIKSINNPENESLLYDSLVELTDGHIEFQQKLLDPFFK